MTDKSKPALQHIPIKSELGMEIRARFTGVGGWLAPDDSTPAHYFTPGVRTSLCGEVIADLRYFDPGDINQRRPQTACEVCTKLAIQGLIVGAKPPL